MDKKPNPQGFFSALEALTERRKMKASGCQLGGLLSELPERERNKLNEILSNLEIPATGIAQVLQENGYKIHISTVRYHRAGINGKGCKCFRTT